MNAGVIDHAISLDGEAKSQARGQAPHRQKIPALRSAIAGRCRVKNIGFSIFRHPPDNAITRSSSASFNLDCSAWQPLY
jgi:hypothetical protein